MNPTALVAADLIAAAVPLAELLQTDLKIKEVPPENHRQYIGTLLGARVLFLVQITVHTIHSVLHYYISDIGCIIMPWYTGNRSADPYKNRIHDWLTGLKRQKVRQVAKARMALIKEELMAAAWAPERVAKLVEAGAWDAID